MRTTTCCLLALSFLLPGCAEHHSEPRDSAVTDQGEGRDGGADASRTVCDFLITESRPCPSDCLSIYGLVLGPADTCVDIVSQRGTVWCATNGDIQSFSGACFVLADGTRAVVNWTPMNPPSDDYCNLPNCIP